MKQTPTRKLTAYLAMILTAILSASAASQGVVFHADFDSDVPGLEPNLSPPGPPNGNSLTLSTNGGPITTEMQAALLGVMGEFEEVGSPGLAILIGEFRTALDIENIAGNSAADLQDCINNNSMDAEPPSWSKVKSMYRSSR